MPFARCRYYTESGEPVRGGCRRIGAGCAFIHPDDHNWADAPPPKCKNGDFNFKPPGRPAAPSTWDTGGNASSSTTDTGDGWNTGGGWGTGGGGGWDTGGGWGGGGSWDTGGSTSTPNQAQESTQPKNTTITNSWGPSASTNNNWNQADATSGTTNSGDGGGWETSTGADKTGGNDGWGGSSWGGDKEGDKSGWGNSDWGSKEADKSSGWDAARDGWGGGGGWGTSNSNNNNNGGGGGGTTTSSSWGVSDPKTTDNQVEKGTDRSKAKTKPVPVPPRIRIPEYDKRKSITGTNNEPLRGSKSWGEPRSASHVQVNPAPPTPVAVSTPIALSTPTESVRIKRKRDITFEDKPEVFKEYMKTWERALRAKHLLAEAEAKRVRWYRTQKSASYARIGEAGRQKLDGQRAECDTEVNVQSQKLSAAITALIDFHDTISPNIDMGQHYNIGEQVQTFLSESKAFVDEARSLLVACVLKDKDDAEAQNRSPESDNPRFDGLKKRLQDLEERFEQAQTELTLRHQRDIRSEIDEHLTTKITDLRTARQQEIDRVASQPRPEIDIPPSGLLDMERTAQHMNDLGKQVPHIVENLRVLLLRVDAMTKRHSELEQEVSKNQEAHSQAQVMAAKSKETERRIEKRVQDAQGLYERAVATEPPVLADGWQDLMQSLEPRIESRMNMFYGQHIRPTIDCLEHAVIEASERQHEEITKVLWGKMQPAMNMVAGVSQWLDSQELKHTAPIPRSIS